MSDTERILSALNEAAVRYLIVGGVAVVLHGHLRATKDLDLVIQLERENLLRALEALGALGFLPLVPVGMLEFADPQKRETWIREKNMVVFSLWHPDKPTQKIDIFVDEPFDFDSALDSASWKSLGSTKVPVVSLEDLIEMKSAAGRPQDLADIDTLEILKRRLEGGA